MNIKDLMFNNLKWGKKGQGKMLSAEEILIELAKRGLPVENISPSRLGMHLTKNKYFYVKKSVLRYNPNNDDLSHPYKNVRTYFVEFKNE